MSPSTALLRRQTVATPRRAGRGVGILGGGLLLALLFLALFPAQVAPYDPTERVGRPFASPSAAHLLGTNDIGQDLLSELIWATRVSLFTGITVSLGSVAVGTLVGLLAGYYHNLAATLLLRLVDLALVLPFLPLVILLSAYLGPSQRNVILVLALVSWAGPARLIRSHVLTLQNVPYIEAARALGSGDRRILRHHLLPAVRSLVVVQLILVAGTSILAEASLSFLGLGDPATKSWGTMLFFAQANGVFLSEAWRWWVLPPGLMITLAVLSLVLIGFALEQRLEPTLHGPGKGG